MSKTRIELFALHLENFRKGRDLDNTVDFLADMLDTVNDDDRQQIDALLASKPHILQGICEVMGKLDRDPNIEEDYAFSLTEKLNCEGGDRALELIWASKESMQEHFLEFEDDEVPTTFTVTLLRKAAGDAHPYAIEVGVIAHPARALVKSVLWDRFTIPCEHAAIAALNVGVVYSGRVRYDAEVATEKFVHPLERYHPVRLETTRSFVKRHSRLIAEQSGRLYQSQLQEMASEVATALQEEQVKIPLCQRLDAIHSAPLIINMELGLLTRHGAFQQHGRQIFDFPPALTQLLAGTTVDDVPVTMIKSPYPAQYLYFGRQPDLEFEPGWCVDGAYVRLDESERTLKIMLTSASETRQTKGYWAGIAEPCYAITIEGSDFDGTVGAGIANSFANRERHLSAKVLTQSSTETTESGMQVGDGTASQAAGELALERRRLPVAQKAVDLLINALCYLTSQPDDFRASYPENAPAPLTGIATGDDRKAAEKARSKLEALGFRPIHFYIGPSLEMPVSGAGFTGGHMPRHWRRGHWRQQVHGEGRALRKLIWIRPMLINADDDDDGEAKGQIYFVS